MDQKKYKATVDGREVDVEILDGDETYSSEGQTRTFKRDWKDYLPIVSFFFISILLIVLSITLFIWALPVLIPVFIVIFVVRLLSR